MPYISAQKRRDLQKWMEGTARRLSQILLPVSIRPTFSSEDAYGVALLAMMTKAGKGNTDLPLLYAVGEAKVIDSVRKIQQVGRTVAEAPPHSTKQRLRKTPMDPYDPRHAMQPGEVRRGTLPDTADTSDPIGNALSRIIADELLANLKPRTADIIRKWADGWSDRELALEHGVSHVRIIQIRTAGMKRLRTILETQEPEKI